MKKINHRKLLILGAWTLGIAGLLASLGFVSGKEKNTPVTNVEVSILNSETNSFLCSSDVVDYIEAGDEKLKGRSFGELNLNRLEKNLNAHPAIENAEVSKDLNGIVRVDVTQRTPILRVINADGESYYIDDRSKIMPLSENYSSRVLIATGHINEPFARRYQFSVDAIASNTLFAQVSILDDLLAVTRAIVADSALSSMITQMQVNSENEIELYPAIGSHKIILGSADNAVEKLNKLKLFYREGLTKTDSWNKYSIINLKFKDQVVCTKK